MRITVAAVLIAILGWVSSGMASKIDSRVYERLTGQSELKVWVFLTDKSTENAQASAATMSLAELGLTDRAIERRHKRGQKPGVSQLDLPVAADYSARLAGTGARIVQTSKWLNAISLVTTREQLAQIAALPFVSRIQPVLGFKRPELVETPAEVMATPADLNYGLSFDQLNQINAVNAHRLGYNGAGVIVTMLDTGYNLTHESFAAILSEGRLLAQHDFIFNDGNVQNEANDVSGQHDHGTATWSTLGGYADGKLIGPAYKAHFILAKTEDLPNETPVEEDYWIAAIEWAEGLGTDVANSSLSYLDWYTYAQMDGDTAPITRAADIAAGLGVVICVSLGNSGGDPTHPFLGAPADADSILTVGAVDATGARASFNSDGVTADGRLKPEVMARGVSTRCARARSAIGYYNLSGTSLSSPLVAGCAAQLLQAHPDWTMMQIREALMMTASQATHPDTLLGWGIIDVVAAINYQRVAALTLLSFQAQMNGPGVKLAWQLSDLTHITGIRVHRQGIGPAADYSGISPILAPTTVMYEDHPSSGFAYRYFIEALFADGRNWQSPEHDVFVENAAARPSLQASHPNPFSDQTTLAFYLPAASTATVRIYDSAGRMVRTILDQELLSPGEHNLSWNGQSQDNRQLANGIYFWSLQTNAGLMTARTVLLR